MADQAMAGGWSGTEDATEDTQKICDALKDQVEQQTGKNYAVYKAVKFREQIVVGTNLSVKVFVGEEDYIHLAAFHQLHCKGGNVELVSVEVRKTKHDPLSTF